MEDAAHTAINKVATYDYFAYYYDLFYKNRREDRALYFELWQELGKNASVLELACGSGRLLIPLAKAGVSITGLDLSKSMLELARTKIEQQTPEVVQRVSLVQGDMTALEAALGSTHFDLIILGFNTFPHLLSDEAQLACLQSVFQQLSDGGRFALAMLNPASELELSHQRLKFMGVFPNPLRESTVKLLISVTDDPATGRSHHQYQFYETLPDDTTEIIVGSLDFYYLHKAPLQQLLAEVGFKILNCYGDYDRSPFADDSPRLIFICGK